MSSDETQAKLCEAAAGVSQALAEVGEAAAEAGRQITEFTAKLEPVDIRTLTRPPSGLTQARRLAMNASARLNAAAKRRKMSKKEVTALIFREVKRRMVADGVVADPSKQEPKYEWHWEWPGKDAGIVKANTRSEARAKIKTRLGGLKAKDRLPADVQIVRVDPNATE